MNKEKITTSANKKLSPEEIKRVKGLGCLQDKRYDDIFNIRVITCLLYTSCSLSVNFPCSYRFFNAIIAI